MSIFESDDMGKPQRFEKIIIELLKRLINTDIKFDVLYNDKRIDILMGNSNDPKNPLTAVEIKYYRPDSRPAKSVLYRAVNSLKDYINDSEISNGLLIISCDLFWPNRIERNESGIEVWNLSTIIHNAKKHPDIIKELYDLLELDANFRPIMVKEKYIKNTIKNLNDLFELDKNLKSLEVKENYSEDLLIGESLLLEIKEIPKGRDGAYKFETWCISALKYLFGEYLTGWHVQSQTIDELNRRDLVCRVKSNTSAEIWELISDTLRSRYVVFEFKNYNDEVGQREVITTERYLYPTALRNCAFLISREGASKSAKRVIEGAMREHGKLIISLSYDDVSVMLKGKNEGNDPNVYLFDKVDEFLISLSR